MSELRIVILILLIIANSIGIVTVFRTTRGKEYRPFPYERTRLIFTMGLGFWIGVAFGAKWHGLANSIAENWGLHIALLINAISFWATIWWRKSLR